jgi:hypothetical protein
VGLEGFVPPSPTAGQASLEYLAISSLMALVLVLAAPAVGVPSVARAVVRTVRLGICVVAHDYCTADEARTDGLGPCALGRRVRGKDDALSVGFLRIGRNDDWTVSAASDGSVTLTYSKGGGAGLVAGIGVDAPSLKLDVGVEGSVGFRVQEATSWTFPDRAAAKAFIAALPGSRDSPRYPPAWRSGTLGGALAAGATAKLAGLDAASLEAAARAGAGVRLGPGDAVTIFNQVTLDAPELKALGSQIVGVGSVRLMEEKTFVHGVPVQYALREAIPSQLGNRVTEVVRRLDMRYPGSRFAVGRFVDPATLWPPRFSTELRGLLEYMSTEATIERATYATNDTSKSAGFTLKAGEELGFSHTWIRIAQTLQEASAKAPGAKPRERFDCVDQLR